MTMHEIATHEAAHAVVATVLRHARGVEHVSILPDPTDGTLGKVTFRARVPGAEATWESSLAQAIAFAAGEIAASRMTGEQQAFGEIDLEGVVLCGAFARMSAPPGRLSSGRALKLAERLISIMWPEIEAVALELLQSTGLDGVRVREIVAQRWPAGISVADLDVKVMKADLDAHEIVMRELRSIATRSRKRSA